MDYQFYPDHYRSQNQNPSSNRTINEPPADLMTNNLNILPGGIQPQFEGYVDMNLPQAQSLSHPNSSMIYTRMHSQSIPLSRDDVHNDHYPSSIPSSNNPINSGIHYSGISSDPSFNVPNNEINYSNHTGVHSYSARDHASALTQVLPNQPQISQYQHQGSNTGNYINNGNINDLDYGQAINNASSIYPINISADPLSPNVNYQDNSAIFWENTGNNSEVNHLQTYNNGISSGVQYSHQESVYEGGAFQNDSQNSIGNFVPYNYNENSSLPSSHPIATTPNDFYTIEGHSMLSTDYKLQQDTPGHKGFISDSTMSEYVIPSKPMEINISKSPVLKNDYLKNENPSELDIIIVDDNSNLQKRKSVSSAPQIYQLSEESNKTVSTKRFKVADSLSKSKPAKDIPNKSQHISSITSPTPVPNNAAEKYTTPLLGYSTSAESVFACSNPPAAIRQKIESLFTAFSFNEVRLVENLVTFLTSISEKHWKSEQDYFNVAISECIVYGIRDSFWRKISRNSSIIARIRNYLVSKIKEKNFLETEPVIRVLAKMSISKTVLDNFKLEKPLLLLDKKGDPSIKRLIKHILDFAQGPEISSDDESLDELQPNMKMDRPTIPVVLAQPVKRTAQAIPNPTVANTSPITASAPASKLVDKGNISIKSPSQPLLAINNTKPVTKKIVSGPPQTGNKGFFNKFGKSSTLLAGTTSSSTPNLSISAPSFKSTDSALYKPPVTLYKSPTPAVKTPTAPAARFSLGSTLDKLRASKTSTKPVTSDSSATTETVKVSKKKTVRFKSDKDLVEVRVFYKDADPDHTHTRNLKEARDLDREEVKSFNYHDAEEEEDLEYRPPISIQFNFNSSNSNMFGRGGSIQADSPEKKLQIDRESSVLVAIYSDDSDIPYSPAEPKAGDQDKAAANSCKKMIVPYELSHNVRYAEKFSQTNVDMSSDISKPTNWNSGNEVTGNNNLANLTSILNSLTRNSVTPSLQELYPTVALNNYSNNNREVPEPGYYNGPPQSDQVIPNLNQRPVSMGSDNALSNILRQLAQSSGGDAGSGGYQGNGMVMNDYSNQKTNYEYDNDRNNLQLNSVYTKASNDHRSRYADSPHPPSSEIIDLRLRDARPLVVSTATTQDMTKWTSLCKFFPLKKGCWRGDSCIYLHVRDNNY